MPTNPDKNWNSGEFCLVTLIMGLFLEQVATACINMRLANPDYAMADPDEVCEPCPSLDPEHNTCAVVPSW